jgi:hypothetical protein
VAVYFYVAGLLHFPDEGYHVIVYLVLLLKCCIPF